MRLGHWDFVRIKSVLFPIAPSTGGGLLFPRRKVIRLAKKGCANRHFFHVVVTNRFRNRDAQPFEQLGTFDPMANDENQKLFTLNLERVRYWLGRGARASKPVENLLGMIGFFPIHPRTVEHLWRRREIEEKAKAKAAAGAKS